MIDIQMAVPDGWVSLPTAAGTDRERAATIELVVAHAVPESLPRDRAEPWRRQLRKELSAAADEAGEAGARSVVLPVEEYNGFRLPGSLLLTVLEDDPEVDAEQMLSSILADAGPRGLYLEVGGASAVRVESSVDSRHIGRSSPSVRVVYYVSHPESPGVWGLLTFTVLTDGDVDAAPVRAVVLTFDAVVSTLRWGERGGRPHDGAARGTGGAPLIA
ncbi:hypothetical protein JQN72_17650 [Phycicoccus sp. CSK15P-2]|uniref:hypothetical protein n=1 Tax=Phycicoccus sp. CSK15P-2 TaxID=2807627 RepID=UPI00194E1C6D|nr:hypothetical protein [Phycicoccus sp. CSK15P-2]MBM6406065.1 hypothetical protein [Phycicoccus sp. CSK15P-2]